VQTGFFNAKRLAIASLLLGRHNWTDFELFGRFSSAPKCSAFAGRTVHLIGLVKVFGI
jgi:hypothetical protein